MVIRTSFYQRGDMFFKKRYIVLFALHTAVALYENKYGPEYGSEWLFFLADNGSTHVMNFSEIPIDNRGLLFGDAHFHLYTRENTANPEVMRIPDENSEIKSLYFNASNDIRVITHGWLSDDTTEWLQNIKAALLRKYDINVITVDWSNLSKNPIYPWSALSTRYVGKRLAKLLNALVKTYQVKGENMHLIGHSLGAQVMGYAGMHFEGEVCRITGLDPARPLFEIPYMGKNFRLEKSDARFVDIIHTCGGVLGYKESHGHSDFYPNKGQAPQPGCEGVQHVIEGCSHGRSCVLFEESIGSTPRFLAFPCESWEKFENGECKEHPAYMGYPATKNISGDCFLYTRNESKFAMDG